MIETSVRLKNFVAVWKNSSCVRPCAHVAQRSYIVMECCRGGTLQQAVRARVFVWVGVCVCVCVCVRRVCVVVRAVVV
jgi:hypothetical protein